MKQFMVIAVQKSAEGIVAGTVPVKARTNPVRQIRAASFDGICQRCMAPPVLALR